MVLHQAGRTNVLNFTLLLFLSAYCNRGRDLLLRSLVGSLPREVTMTAKFIFGDDEGMVYAITTAGDLMWYRHRARAGTPDWVNDGIGQRIGWGWSGFTQVVTGGNGVIYTVDPNGVLRWYHHTSRTGEFAWAPNSGTQIDVGWNAFTRVFSGGGGVLYGIDPDGNLWWYEHLSLEGLSAWAFDGEGQLVDTGWNNFINVFSGGNGVIYAIQPDGTLLWYQHLSRTGENLWTNDGEGQPIDIGWNNFSHVFSSGDGVIYAVESNGDLLWYEHLSRQGEDVWANDGEGQRIGIGWELPVIEGYATPITAAPGETIDFRMSTGADAFTVTYLRLKQQPDGSIGIPMADPFLITGRLKDIPDAAYETDCDWDADFTLEVPADWPSGLYAAQCKDTEGFAFHVVFVVKPNPANRRDFAVLANTNTWNAYNSYGGRSQYTNPNAVILTLERPNPVTSPVDDGALNHLTRAELWVHNWLEDAGYQFDVYSDLDLHQGIPDLESYKALIVHTHPEYWTSEMMDQLESYLAQGGRLLYLAGNGLYEQVQWAGEKMILRGGDPAQVGARRPPTFEDPPNLFSFRDLTPPRPERAILGVAYEDDNWSGTPSEFAPLAVKMADHRFFAGTELNNGDLIGQSGHNGAASGWEIDSSVQLPFPHRPGAPPANIQILAEGTNSGPMNNYAAQMTYYDTAAGGFVFAAGSLTFGGSLAVDSKLQQVLQNVLNECLQA